MLVKFKNDTEDFDTQFNALKTQLGMVTASKVAEHCFLNYMSLNDSLDASYTFITELQEKLQLVETAYKKRSDSDAILSSVFNAKHEAKR